MSFWTLLLLCLLTLAVQSAVIIVTALRALRGIVELRWSTYLGLQKLLLKQIDDAGGAHVQSFELLLGDAEKGFEDSLVMVRVRKAVTELAYSQTHWTDCLRQHALRKGVLPQQSALPLRVLHARQAYDAAVDAFERMRLGFAASLLARWLRLGPVYHLESAMIVECDSNVGMGADAS